LSWVNSRGDSGWDDAELADKRKASLSGVGGFMIVASDFRPTSGSSFRLLEILNQARPEGSEAHATGVADDG